MSFSSSFGPTNLQNFLHSVTPIIPSKDIHQSSLHDISNPSPFRALNHSSESFFLSELWECFDEWSAYGAGTQVVLNNGEIIDQYYVPYLSAIQIYTTKPPATLWTPKKEGFGAIEVPFWSDESKSEKLSRSSSNISNKTWDFNSGDSSPKKGLFGHLYFEYFDNGSPYWRIPFNSRVAEYIDNYNGLCSFRNAELSPASWMAVAWYPIYHVPSKISIKEMQACFLTFHTLSAYYQETFSTVSDDYENTFIPPHWEGVPEYYPKWKVRKTRNYICLPPFGLATYRLQGDVWVNPNSSDATQLCDLHNAACAWLKQLNVQQHHDFTFFSLHSAFESF